MSNLSRLTPESSQNARRSDTPALRTEYVRIARALLGVTPAQLAEHIGLTAQPAPQVEAVRPAQTLERLSAALHSVIGWYQMQLGPDAPTAPEQAREAGLDRLLRDYLALRSDWENRAANDMSARMNLRVQVPCAVGHAPASEKPANAPAAPRRALLVDDASDVVVTVGAFLESFGFEVTRAPDGDAALRILSDHAPIDLLVTDYAMPGMTGKDLALQACERHPELRVLIITGYPDAEELGALPYGVMLLAKPFRRAELAALVHQLFTVQAKVSNTAEIQKA